MIPIPCPSGPDWTTWLCDREQQPAGRQPLDVRNASGHHIADLVRDYSADRLSIYHYLSADIAPITALRHLQSLAVVWAPKLTDLSPIAELSKLEAVYLADVRRVQDVSVLGGLRRLRVLSIEGGMWKPWRILTLQWIRALKSLETVEIWNVRLADNDITVLAELPALIDLKLANTWRLDQFARLSAQLGGALTFPQPLNRTTVDCSRCGDTVVMLIGSGTRLRCPRCDGDQIARHLHRFQMAVERARTEV